MTEVVVLGSANADLVLAVPSIPRPGETVLATAHDRHAGGKGLNQAVAAARAGASTAFIGAVGADDPGLMLRAVLTSAGVDTPRLRETEDSTGLAVVVVDEQGENSIIVASGANAGLRDLDETDLDMIRAARVLVLQLEVPVPTVVAAASAARAAGVRVVLNAAPAQALPVELLDRVDVLVVNQHEALTLVPQAPPETATDDRAGLVTSLLELVPTAVVTLGADGAVFGERGNEPQHQRAPLSRVVDSTGAGDAFTGALASALARGEPLADAVWFGSCAGSLAVEIRGAVPSIPRLAAIAERMRVTNRRDGWPDPCAARLVDLPVEVPLDEGADLSALDHAKVLAAPPDRRDWAAWRRQLRAWRTSARERHGYDDTRYTDPANAWTARCWNVAVIWLWDEALYDWERGTFDVDHLMATYAPFGGLDGVVLWHAYPVIGIDPRNQFDYYREVPELADLVHSLQRHGIRVFLDYNPWDVGTHRAAGNDADELAALVTETGADGVFLDTLRQGDARLRDVLFKLDPGPALEGESAVPTGQIGDHLLSWAQWMADSEVPGVLRARWFEQRHMMHHTRRWNIDHTDELQSAWLNGVGVLIWDVVFGSYVGWSPRDLSVMRAMRRVQLALADHLVHGQWTPLPGALTVEATSRGVYGASYELAGCTLWPLVNRRDEAFAGSAITSAGGTWYDLVAGRTAADTGSGVEVTIPARAIGGLLHVPDGAEAPAGLAEVLAAAATDPLVLEANVPQVRARMVDRSPARGEPLPGAVVVGAGMHRLSYRARVRETGLRYSPAYPPGTWKPLPPRLHGERTGSIGHTSQGVAVDAAEVTNADFARFLAMSGYRPKVSHRFLAHWGDDRPVPGTEAEPVTYVDLDDARSYATWRGARLPIEPEWQIAAGDPAFRRTSPLVWNWTEPEYRDGRTRWTMLKGGSWYAADGSEWYADGGPQQPDWLSRLVLPGGGLARSATIGFRCAVDLGRDEVVPGGLGGWTEFEGG